MLRIQGAYYVTTAGELWRQLDGDFSFIGAFQTSEAAAVEAERRLRADGVLEVRVEQVAERMDCVRPAE
jgi:hypothetical protein